MSRSLNADQTCRVVLGILRPKKGGGLPKKGEDLMMQDEQPTASVDRELATQIVAAYVRRNQIGSDQLPALIATVYQALGRLGKQLAEPAGERTPAVPLR